MLRASERGTIVHLEAELAIQRSRLDRIALKAARYAKALRVRKVPQDWPALWPVVEWLESLCRQKPETATDSPNMSLPTTNEEIEILHDNQAKICIECIQLEREACAKVVEQAGEFFGNETVKNIASLIRARGPEVL